MILSSRYYQLSQANSIYVRNYLKKHNIKQYEYANKMNINSTLFNEILNGKRYFSNKDLFRDMNLNLKPKKERYILEPQDTYLLLRGGYGIKELASMLNLVRENLSCKLHGHLTITIDEIKKLEKITGRKLEYEKE